MRWSPETLVAVFERTSGICHICHRELVLKNHNARGARGAWHVDHSVPRARGGTDRLNNLLPAHIGCNNEKSTRSTRSTRAKYGKRKKPMSEAERERARGRNALGFGAGGATIGAMIAGPPGAFFGAGVAALVGLLFEPEDE